MPSSVTQDAIDRLDDAVDRSKRSASVRLPVAFVRDVTTKSYSPPLSRLLRDRGETRLRVYLLLRMMATGHPYEKTVSNRELAQILGLRDPEAAGTRRVAKAVQDLEELKLIERTLRPGHVPISRVLNPAGDGSDWNDKKIGNVYVTVPIELWRRGWLLHLSGRATALFIILRELTGGRDKTGIYVDAVRKRQYRLSEDTWGRATRELVSAGLLTVDRHGQAHQGEHRLRNFYQLDLARLQDDPFGPRDVL